MKRVALFFASRLEQAPTTSMSALRSQFGRPLWAFLIALALVSHCVAQPAKRGQEDLYREDVVPFLKKHCLECHGPTKQESDIAFHKYKTADSIAADEKTWKTVIEMLETGAMPPEDKPQPSPEQRQRIARWLEATIYHVDCNLPPDPGRV